MDLDFEEKSLVEFAEKDLRDLLDADCYGEALRGSSDLDFASLLENCLGGGSGVILNDRLMTEASLGMTFQLENPLPTSNEAPQREAVPIKTEHSYSLSEGQKKPELLDLDTECYPAVAIDEAEGSRATCRSIPYFPEGAEDTVDAESISQGWPSSVDRPSSTETLSCCGDCCIPDEGSLSDDFSTTDAAVTGVLLPSDNSHYNAHSKDYNAHSKDYNVHSKDYNAHSKNWSEKATTSRDPAYKSPSSRDPAYKSPSFGNPVVVAHRNISFLSKATSEREGAARCEANYVGPSGFGLPPTPPSCSSSDSESGGDRSPDRFHPLYETLGANFCASRKSGPIRNSSARTPITTPLISSQPRGATGTLHLTDEEKKTLISEGYPVPSRLPLTKAEEKSLKKIRRKIKNKISAQESRRKKKEYMDILEQKVDILEQQNKEYRRRMDTLQSKNSHLLEELHKLQTMVKSDEKNRTRTAIKASILS